MAKVFFSLDDIDNTGTLYEQILTEMYPEEPIRNKMLLNTLFLRTSILKAIKVFIDQEYAIEIKEFSDAPAMIYDDPTKYGFAVPEIGTDVIMIKEAFDLTKIREADARYASKYGFSLEALNPNMVTVDTWEKYLDKIYVEFVEGQGNNPRVQKIMFENLVKILRGWGDLSTATAKDMVKDYNNAHGIAYNPQTFWQEPLTFITKNYWEKFSFVGTINDYDIYNEHNAEVLDVIADRYYNNGFFDEIVVKLNYFYWHDDFEKITDWTSRILGSPMVSYRFQTLFSNDVKNRYFDDEEAAKYGDIQRKNTVDEEIRMFDERLPVFLNKILKNPQTLGFELDGGYFGTEGNIPVMELGDDNFQLFTERMCKVLHMSPFAQLHDYFRVYFNQPKRLVYVCAKGKIPE